MSYPSIAPAPVVEPARLILVPPLEETVVPMPIVPVPDPPHELPPSEEALLAAYRICGAMLEHYGRSRSNLRTAFIAFNFAALGALYGRQLLLPTHVHVYILGLSAVMAILFWVIDVHQTHAHRGFSAQAVEHEKKLRISLFHRRCEEKKACVSRIFSETRATYFIYFTALCFWAELFTKSL